MHQLDSGCWPGFDRPHTRCSAYLRYMNEWYLMVPVQTRYNIISNHTFFCSLYGVVVSKTGVFPLYSFFRSFSDIGGWCSIFPRPLLFRSVDTALKTSLLSWKSGSDKILCHVFPLYIVSTSTSCFVELFSWIAARFFFSHRRKIFSKHRWIPLLNNPQYLHVNASLQ